MLGDLGQDGLDEISVDVGQPIVAALEAIGQSGVVDPEQMKDRRVQIVHMHRILGDVVAVFIGLAVDMSTSYPRTGKQCGKAARVVVATIVVGRQRTLRINGSTELASPNDERIVEQTPFFEVLDQSFGRLIGIAALEFDRVRQTAMMVPAHVKELDESNIAFRESSCEQAIGGIGPGAFDIRPVLLEHMGRFVGYAEQIRDAALHAKSHLVLADARLDLRISKLVEVLAIELVETIEGKATALAVHPLGIRQIQHRISFVSEFDPLMLRWQKASSPKPVVQRLIVGPAGSKRRQYDVGRQIFVLTSQSIANPRTDARSTGKLGACLAEGDRRVVVDRFGVHRSDLAPVVCKASHLGHEFAEPHAGFAVLCELEHRRSDWKFALTGGHGREPLSLANRFGKILPASVFQLGFRIEKIDLRGCPGLKQINDPLGLGRMMDSAAEGLLGARLAASEGHHGREPKTPCRAFQKGLAVDLHGISFVHSRVMTSSRFSSTFPARVYAARSAVDSTWDFDSPIWINRWACCAFCP